MLETLTYHEGGHLLNEENPGREYRTEEAFGGGHCTNGDVMTDKGIYGRIQETGAKTSSTVMHAQKRSETG